MIFTDALFDRAQALCREGMTVAEAAAQLGVKEGSLRVMAHHAGRRFGHTSRSRKGRRYRKREEGAEAETARNYTIRLDRDRLLERLNAGLR